MKSKGTSTIDERNSKKGKKERGKGMWRLKERGKTIRSKGTEIEKGTSKTDTRELFDQGKLETNNPHMKNYDKRKGKEIKGISKLDKRNLFDHGKQDTSSLPRVIRCQGE